MQRSLALLCLLSLAACGGTAPTRVALVPPPGPAPEQDGFLYCVPYARAVSGIEIFGDAWTWWQGAAGRYERGQRPLAGAVLVLRRDNRLPYGHVSVVSAVVGPREIRVSHANWGYAGKPRGQIDRDVPVIDVSPNNDWSEIRVWNGGSFGRIYPAHGFIYPGDGGRSV